MQLTTVCDPSTSWVESVIRISAQRVPSTKSTSTRSSAAAPPNQSGGQIFGDAAQAETAEHDAGAIGDIGDGFVCAGEDFIHKPSV